MPASVPYVRSSFESGTSRKLSMSKGREGRKEAGKSERERDYEDGHMNE